MCEQITPTQDGGGNLGTVTSQASVRRAGGVTSLLTPPAATWRDRYRAVRAWTHALCEPLVTEDYVVRTMQDVSPTKWHIAHTSWFFETFVLGAHLPGYRALDPRYAYLFNSYYVQAGERHCRAKRGLVTRPTVAQVYEYRAHVDEHMMPLLERLDAGPQDSAADQQVDAALAALVELGLNHEQQHQELILTDIKHVLWMNPLRPTYAVDRGPGDSEGEASGGGDGGWLEVPGGLYEIGHAGASFSFDNEGPRHRVWLEPFRIASRLVTNRDYLAFIADGGYRRPTLWLSAGWDTVRTEGWEAPLYWEGQGDDTMFTLRGTRPLDLDEPVCHVSYFEADAYARWAGGRLPTEAEWEVVAAAAPMDGAFAESRRFHPLPGKPDARGVAGLYGAVWQWTASPYTPYPGFRSAPGAIGEYNGKFMCDQWVLRGASVATPRTHARLTYRNFFPGPTRWQFSGLRLAADA